MYRCAKLPSANPCGVALVAERACGDELLRTEIEQRFNAQLDSIKEVFDQVIATKLNSGRGHIVRLYILVHRKMLF